MRGSDDRSPHETDALCLDGVSLRIVVVLPGFQVGGAETQALLLARALQQAGAHVLMLALLRDGPFGARIDRAGVARATVGLYSWPLALPFNLLRTLHALRRFRPDVILPYTALPNLYGGLLWRLAGARTCVWNQRDCGLSRPHARLERWAARRTPARIANAEGGAAFLARVAGVPQTTIRVVRNGVPAPLPRCVPARRDLGLPEDRLLACMVGKIAPGKNHATLLRAWVEVRSAVARAGVEYRRRNGHAEPPMLVLAGRVDRAAPDPVRQCRDLGIAADVAWLGEVDHVESLLAACDLGVFSAVSEGAPNGVLECMAAGLPVVATDLPGIRGCLPPEQHACLAPPDDPAGLAARIVELLLDPERRKRLGCVNRDWIVRFYSVENMVRDTWAVVREALR